MSNQSNEVDEAKLSRLEGKVEALSDQISVIAEIERTGTKHFKNVSQFFSVVLIVFVGGSGWGAYQIAQFITDTNTQIIGLIEDTKQEVRYITGQARPASVSIERIQSGNPGYLPALLEVIQETDTSNYRTKLSFNPSVSVVGYPGKFIGWFHSQAGELLDWRSKTGVFRTSDETDELAAFRTYTRERYQVGEMTYNGNLFGSDPVTISPSAPFTGQLFMTGSITDCNTARNEAVQLWEIQSQQGHVGTITLSPILENYPTVEGTEFAVEIIVTSSVFSECHIEPPVVVVETEADNIEASDQSRVGE